jgi:hypothetical protein
MPTDRTSVNEPRTPTTADAELEQLLGDRDGEQAKLAPPLTEQDERETLNSQILAGLVSP